MVAAEGSGLLVFEELEHAKARGAKIYGEVIGFGASCLPSNHQKAIELAVSRALNEAGVKPSELGHVVANGTGCVDDDRVESHALASLLGDAVNAVPVVAYKSYMGHLAAASGAVELAASLFAMKHGVLPATLNYSRPDAGAPALRILRESVDFPNKPFLAYDLSVSGQCGALVLRPFVG
ncbi:MAG: hypothetical protein U1D30_16735 [Planctomycetota bacterium]